MKIYRFALRKDIARQITDSAEARPFPKLFRDQKRIVIPLKNDAILDIVKNLEHGNTTTMTKYRVDLDNKVAYRYIVTNEATKLDPRPMRLGKVIFKELGKEQSDQWSIQQNSIQDTDYSIILSRDPIDVARMSDHYRIVSCHSPGEQYFSSAQQEAINGGAVAYLVKNEDINNFIEDRGGIEHLEDRDIFTDRDRGIKGIVPVSRLRINKYHEEDDETQQIALPINRLYGADNVAGFFDTVKQYLYTEQEKYIDYEKLYLNNYKRAGGDYADERDKEIIEDYFGNDMGVKKDLEHEGGDVSELYNQEFKRMCREINEKLNYSSVYADASHDDGYLNIYSGVTIVFRIRATLLSNKDYIESKHVQELRKALKLDKELEIEEVYIKEEGDVIEVSIRCGFFDDGYGGIRNPDDFERSTRDVISYEEEHYIADLYALRGFLITSRIIMSEDAENRDQKFSRSIKNNVGGDIVYEEGMIIIAIPLNYKLKEEIWGYGNMVEREKIKNDVKLLFKDIVKRELLSFYERENKQIKFNFYTEDMSEIKKVLDYVPRFQVTLSKEVDDHPVNNYQGSKRKMIISIPETELIEAGSTYFNMFFDMLVRIHNEILRFLQYKYAEGGNIGYNKEWSKYLKDKELEEQKKIQLQPPQTELTLPPKQEGGEITQQVQNVGEVVPANNKSWYRIAVKCEAHS